MRTLSSFTPRAALLATVAASVMAAPAGAAEHQRFYALGPSGDEVTGAQAVAVSDGGREVAFNAPDPASGVRGYIRDMVAGTTIALAPDTRIVDASDDLQVIVATTRASYSPADTNNASDGYLLDRRTGRVTLVTRASTTGAALGRAGDTMTVSGDGRLIHFSDVIVQSTPPYTRSPQGPRRFDVATSTITALPDKQEIAQGATDVAGNVLVAPGGLFVRGAFRPIAAMNEARRGRDADEVVSQDGSAAAYLTSDEHIRVVLSSSSTTLLTELPAEIRASYLQLLGITSGGNYALIGWRPTTSETYRTGAVNIRTGAIQELVQIVPQGATNLWNEAVSGDLKFGASRSRMLSLQGDPIPGADPVIPGAPARSYVTYYPGCNPSYFPSYYPPVRPSLVLNARAVGANPRVPVRAQVTVRVTATGAIASQFTTTPGQRVYLYGGYGGTTITGRITFDDGSTADLNERINRYTPPTNAPYIFAPGLNDCTNENALW